MKRIALLLRRYPWLVTGSYGVWRRFQARYSVGAVGIIMNTRQQVLLVEHAFHPKAPWGLPGGWVGRNEDPADTVRREIQEEMQLTVKVGQVILVEVPYQNHLDLAYLCQMQSDIGQLSFELLNYDWFDTNALPRLMPFHYRAIMHMSQLVSQMEFSTWLQD